MARNEFPIGAASGRFEVVRLLGEGAVGAVYEVNDRERGHHVALKLLKEASPETLLSLKREFRTLSNITHPNLIAYHDLIVDEAAAFFTMELVPGGEPLRYVREGGSLQQSRLRHVLGQLASGLALLHDNTLVHRDIKPSNILVTPEGRAVLLDFGLALAIEQSHDADEGLAGTIAYMSPEQACGETLTAASDMYSLGVLLYEALTERRPFEGSSTEILDAKIQRLPTRPRERAASVPDDLDALCMELLDQDPSARPDAFQVLARLGVQSETSRTSRSQQFVGREAEMRQLGAIAERRGQARIVLLQGPSGIGKSATFRHFVGQLRELHDGVIVLEGRCYEGERIAFQGIDDVVDHLAQTWSSRSDQAALLPPEGALLARLFPVLCKVPAVAGATREGPEIANVLELRSRAFTALRTVFQRLAERSLLVVHLDDMQWADADTQALLADLMRPPDPPAMLLVLGSRIEGIAALQPFLEGTGIRHEVIAMAPLPDDQALRLAEELLGANAREAARIVREAEGNPFFLGELARSVQHATIGGGAGASLDDVVFGRVAALPGEARRLLEGVALSFAPITLRVAGTAAGLAPQAALRMARMLRVQRFVKTPAGQRQDRLESYHDRVRKVVTDRAERPEEVHRALAQALENCGDGTHEQLTHHWFAAGDLPRAAVHARAAATRARDALNFDRAAELYRVLLDTGCYGDTDRDGILRDCAEALSLAGRPKEAAEMFLRAVENADLPQQLDGKRRAAEQLLRGGHVSQGLATIQGVLRDFQITLAGSPWIAIVYILLQQFWLRLRGVRWKHRDRTHLRPHDLMRVDVYFSVGQSLTWVDSFRGSDFVFRALHLALRLGETKRIGRALGMEAARRAVMSDGATAIEFADVAIATGDPQARVYGLLTKSVWHYYVPNDWDRATTETDGYIEEMYRSRSGGWELDTAQMIACFSLLYGGRYAELARRVPSHLREAERKGDLYAAVGFRVRLCIQWLLRDDDAAAARDIEGALRGWSPPANAYHLQHFWALYSRCEVALYAGDAPRAAALVDAENRALDRSMLLAVPMLAVEAWHLRARVALAMAEQATGAERQAWLRDGRRAKKALCRNKSPVARPLAMLADAGLRTQRGDRDGAAAILAECTELLDKTNTRGYASAARWRRGELIGGREGAALVDEARAQLEGETVKNPCRMLSMLAPGFGARG